DVERDTRIRTRYLEALEEERFDRIPGLVYAKGFLRTYADYLGLDADWFVDELSSRLPPDEEEAPLAPAPVPTARRRLSGMPFVGLLVVASVGALIWVLGSTSGGPKYQSAAGPAPGPPPPPAPTTLGARHVLSKPQVVPERATLV